MTNDKCDMLGIEVKTSQSVLLEDLSIWCGLVSKRNNPNLILRGLFCTQVLEFYPLEMHVM